MKKKGDMSKAVTIVVIKQWLSVLVKRSLFLELTRGSIQLHDIGPCIISISCMLKFCFVIRSSRLLSEQVQQVH